MNVKRLALALTAVCIALFPSVETTAQVSQSAVLFLRIAPGARAAGMGDAFVAVADDATATHWNPAGLGAYPLSSNWVETNIPAQFRPLRGIAAIKKGRGKDYKDYELWAISARGLIRFSDDSWQSGEAFLTQSDQTIAKKVSSYLNISDESQLDATIRKVAASNNRDSYESLVSLRDSVAAYIPEGYKRSAELQSDLDSLVSAYMLLRVDWDQVDEIRHLYAEGIKDSKFSDAEADRISFAVERSRSRYIPEEITIPYDALSGGELTSISTTGDVILVGTSEGLIEYNGRNWKRLTTRNGLPSNNVLTLAAVGSQIMIGTDAGAIVYNGLALDSLESVDMLPQGPVSAVGGTSPTNLFAVVGGDLYRYDGKTWSNTMSYTAVIDDTPEKIAAKFSIYGSEADKQKYLEKFNRQVSTLPGIVPSSGMVPSPDDSVTALVSTTLEAGKILSIPYLAEIKGEVYSIHSDARGNIWLGTEYGLLRMTGDGWTMPGYRDKVVEAGETLDDVVNLRLNQTESEREKYTQSLQVINDLSDGQLTEGTTIQRYGNATGSAVKEIRAGNQQIFIATAEGLIVFKEDRLQRADFAGLERGVITGMSTVNDEAWFATNDKVAVKARGRTDISGMHVKWLPELADDLYYEFLSVASGKEGIGTFGGNLTFISYGTIQRTGEGGSDVVGSFDSYDIAFTGSFGTSLTAKLKGGVSAKVIYSQLSTQGAGSEQGGGTATGVAIDLGLLYHASPRLNLGMAITNLGPDMAYIDAAQSDPLPRNLAVGFAYKLIKNESSQLLLVGEVNKLLVGLNDRFDREISKQIILNGGAEFMYANLLAIRGGYIYDNEGKVKTFTFGLGLSAFDVLRFDFSYVPSGESVALANTLRVSLSVTP
ncbi:MAG: PorV/PorQ family protein [candidate division Zixibacteria bacterium]|nr:PorV/PorQ family protein [candidate division Zixibacteria bacterium]